MLQDMNAGCPTPFTSVVGGGVGAAPGALGRWKNPGSCRAGPRRCAHTAARAGERLTRPRQPCVNKPAKATSCCLTCAGRRGQVSTPPPPLGGPSAGASPNSVYHSRKRDKEDNTTTQTPDASDTQGATVFNP